MSASKSIMDGSFQWTDCQHDCQLGNRLLQIAFFGKVSSNGIAFFGELMRNLKWITTGCQRTSVIDQAFRQFQEQLERQGRGDLAGPGPSVAIVISPVPMTFLRLEPVVTATLQRSTVQSSTTRPPNFMGER